jgi:Domain of unknown function (DUF4262)
MTKPTKRRRQMPESLGDLLAKCQRTIERHGHGVIGVFPTADSPPEEQFSFGYSYGLAGQGKPELLVTALDSRLATMVINCAVVAGVTAPGEYDEVLEGHKVRAVPVNGEGLGLMNMARHFAPEGGFTALQLVWPDPEGRFPGDDGYDEGRWSQTVYERGA